MLTIVLILYVPMIFASFIVFDQLVKLEYVSHHHDWEADGRPHGFFWVPPEITFAGGWLVRLGSSVAMQRKTYLWLFSTPAWMRRDRKALRLRLCLPTLVIGWYSALVVSFLIAVYS